MTSAATTAPRRQEPLQLRPHPEGSSVCAAALDLLEKIVADWSRDRHHDVPLELIEQARRLIADSRAGRRPRRPNAEEVR